MSTDEEAAHKLVANERRKLSATYLNGVAVALIDEVAFAPLKQRLAHGFWPRPILGVSPR